MAAAILGSYGNKFLLPARHEDQINSSSSSLDVLITSTVTGDFGIDADFVVRRPATYRPMHLTKKRQCPTASRQERRLPRPRAGSRSTPRRFRPTERSMSPATRQRTLDPLLCARCADSQPVRSWLPSDPAQPRTMGTAATNTNSPP